MTTRDARSLPAVAQEDLRRKAVRAVLDGKTQLEIAKIFGVTRQAVGYWVRAYREGGVSGLKAKPNGRPTGGTLRPWQAAQMASALVDRCPDQLKLPFALWTRAAVAHLIERRLKMRLSIWTVGRYRARGGFPPQNPGRRAFAPDSEAVRRWLQEESPAIRRWAKRDGAEVDWGDEMGRRADQAVGRSGGARPR